MVMRVTFVKIVGSALPLGDKIVISFSCKSAFCLSCAKSYSLNWVEKVKAMLHPNVKYRHLILTMPTDLRLIFYCASRPLGG